jgi:thiamine biosynthesis lipoprotein
MITTAFRAMGTRVGVSAPDEASLDIALHRVRTRFAHEEARFSRFREDSELTRVNRAAGAPTPVSGAFAEVLALALAGARHSGGAFDPTVHDALLAAGYDADLDEVLAGARGALHPARPCERWRDITLHDGRVLLPEGVHLDLGGIAKGWTADRAARDAVAAGNAWVLVDAGGDLRIGGYPPPIDVAVEDPFAPGAEVLRLRLRGGALATSSTTRRSWGPGLHHVIDPRTGSPSRSGVVQATVWAPTCAEAEVRATACLVRAEPDPDRPSILIDEHGALRGAVALEEAA